MDLIGGDLSQAVVFSMSTPLKYAYDAIPEPPVSPAAPLVSALAARAPLDGLDRISRLPDQILRNIVSHLLAKDAARTSALASRWRGIWRSAPLTLVDAHVLPDCVPAGQPTPGGEGAVSKAAVGAVSRALAAHPGPVRCFRFTRGHMASHQAEVESWLKLLAAKGVEDLVFFNLPWPLDLPLPAALFSCGASLTSLHLGAWRFPDTAALPRSARFPNLKDLVLSFMVMRDRDLNFLLDRSPVLENLAVISAQTRVGLRVVSRNLRCLQLGLCILEDVAVVDAPLLESLFLYMISPHGKSPTPWIKIGHAPNLRMLGYWQPGNQELQIGNTIIKADTKVSPSTIIPSVRDLSLEVHFDVRNEIKMVPCFLKCFPNVEKLHSLNSDEPTGKLNLKFWREAGRIKCVEQHVKKFVLHEFRGKKSEIVFLQFIAERAQILEQMVVMVSSDFFCSADDVIVKLKLLTSAEWASKEYKLIVFKSPYSSGGSAPWNFGLVSDYPKRDPFDLVTADAEHIRGASVLHHRKTL
ncbi:hypothetical protein PR202_ga16966 [Eleusine coracana subsp. coracana]|uniref:F-box domain-containing protein n=1 Tax=Eleusine coracana subsp. coracana TaxID=191504 RepID=A0AAV5CPN0_ELECO|nr:hypothetical protein PR202_ga16966 [Eleusine coracana subsp. coracana]